MAAAPLRIPVVMWEGNVIPGRSVRATARLADVLAVSFAPTCAAAPHAARPCYVTGTPIRDLRGLDREAARAQLRDPARRPDAPRLRRLAGGPPVQRGRRRGAAPARRARSHVVHVTGDEGYAAALAGREALPAGLRERYRPVPFLRDDMADALGAADLVVGRAGSSTLAEVTALGLPMIVVPYPHAAGHQLANARVLADAGAARLIEDEAFDGAALLAATAILDDPAAHAAMAAASRSLGRPGAADAVAELVLAAAEHAAAARAAAPRSALARRRRDDAR